MITNSDITLYNAYYLNKKKVYRRTYIRGVNWQSKQAVTVTDKGLNSSDTVNIYIPFDANIEGNRKFIKPKSYASLSEEEKDKYFTFGPADVVVKGLVSFNLTGESPNNLEGLNKNYDDVVNIISLSVNEGCSLSMRHYKLGCE